MELAKQFGILKGAQFKVRYITEKKHDDGSKTYEVNEQAYLHLLKDHKDYSEEEDGELVALAFQQDWSEDEDEAEDEAEWDEDEDEDDAFEEDEEEDDAFEDEDEEDLEDLDEDEDEDDGEDFMAALKSYAAEISDMSPFERMAAYGIDVMELSVDDLLKEVQTRQESRRKAH